MEVWFERAANTSVAWQQNRLNYYYCPKRNASIWNYIGDGANNVAFRQAFFRNRISVDLLQPLRPFYTLSSGFACFAIHHQYTNESAPLHMQSDERTALLFPRNGSFCADGIIIWRLKSTFLMSIPHTHDNYKCHTSAPLPKEERILSGYSRNGRNGESSS